MKSQRKVWWDVREFRGSKPWDDREECDDQFEAVSPIEAARAYARFHFEEEAKIDPNYANTLEVRKYSPNRTTKIFLITVSCLVEVDFVGEVVARKGVHRHQTLNEESQA